MTSLLLTTSAAYTMVRRAVAAGASGYLQKNALSEEVLKGIEAVMAGETYFSRDLDRLMKKRTNHAVWLTAREQELLRHIVDGRTNQEIADSMFLSVETIKTYRKNLIQKFGTRNAAELVHVALRDKWV